MAGGRVSFQKETNTVPNLRKKQKINNKRTQWDVLVKTRKKYLSDRRTLEKLQRQAQKVEKVNPKCSKM